MTNRSPSPVATEARKTNPEEIADVTGWDVKAVREAIEQGALPGCRYVPTKSGGGRFLCAWAPFWAWFGNGIESAPVPADQTVKLLHRIERADSLRDVWDDERKAV